MYGGMLAAPSATRSLSPKFRHLLPPTYSQTIAAWLAEDCPSLDYGGFVVGEDLKEASLWCKSPGVLAGVPFFDEVFRQLGCSVQWYFDEGAMIGKEGEGKTKVKAATVRGPARKLLLGERVALNTLARCSGIATASHLFLRRARQAGYRGIVAGTRKTTPGFRLVEKYGMLVGGVDMHRYDLSSMVMLKDNHVWSTGSIPAAVAAARAAAGFSMRIDVEVQSEEEARQAIAAGADVVMLDNLEGQELIDVARRLKSELHASSGVKGGKEFLIESSGGIDLANLSSGGHLDDAIDVISTSAIHQSTKHVDFSLKIEPLSQVKTRGH
ncbi:putative BNA6-nicotinate-nucleotide diphosphorylase [Jaminaea rosea]|uniref:Nicotinate-nucleotide pyrophosphorylase [carboxylating] n=1 Tax=Jaminaea rosea TaxID=1569628 RepID=A0A316V2T9_9BASI|nr:putative BNA6-nicotinate-nucleotide diphosphorylase [Jaminaea rosea]PWN29745.1 putative BNA6-nicotinate-nucleotide diphosphorylase [Jaminaea rosea]